MQKFLRLSLGFLALSLVGAPLLAPHIAQAQVIGEPSDALVVIRFNQPRVYFEQQLYGAIAKAVAVKPDVEFNLISYAPQAGDSEEWREIASKNTQTVVKSMQNMGVPLSRIHVSGQIKSGIKYDETHVYVQ